MRDRLGVDRRGAATFLPSRRPCVAPLDDAHDEGRRRQEELEAGGAAAGPAPRLRREAEGSRPQGRAKASCLAGETCSWCVARARGPAGASDVLRPLAGPSRKPKALPVEAPPIVPVVPVRARPRGYPACPHATCVYGCAEYFGPPYAVGERDHPVLLPRAAAEAGLHRARALPTQRAVVNVRPDGERDYLVDAYDAVQSSACVPASSAPRFLCRSSVVSQVDVSRVTRKPGSNDVVREVLKGGPRDAARRRMRAAAYGARRPVRLHARRLFPATTTTKGEENDDDEKHRRRPSCPPASARGGSTSSPRWRRRRRRGRRHLSSTAVSLGNSYCLGFIKPRQYARRIGFAGAHGGRDARAVEGARGRGRRWLSLALWGEFWPVQGLRRRPREGPIAESQIGLGGCRYARMRAGRGQLCTANKWHLRTVI